MLTERQELILKIIVADYTRTATPIASDAVARSQGLSVSSATVRNDVAVLKEQGYLANPHTSAGSVPLDKAYRFFVESIEPVTDSAIPQNARDRAHVRLQNILQNLDEWANVSAAVLAGLVGNMAIATFPKSRETRVRYLDLVPMQDLLVMLIVVLEQARLHRQLIRLPQPMDAYELEESTARLRSYLMGHNQREIASQQLPLTPLEEELVEATVTVLQEEEKAAYHDHYVDGMRNLLSQPEFAENERARSIVEGVEDGSLAQTILSETPEGGVVRVIIGHEHPDDALSPLSVVVCQYGLPHRAVGALGVVGPTRMEYIRTIAGVRFLSAAMSELLESVYVE
ncbi:MAG: heat-inducible transcriptional repressor HrcA [Chloroflexi bacterium]|nr:heat-inducible transcriptional repressor HrcA [Chloroflexota bacterium]